MTARPLISLVDVGCTFYARKSRIRLRKVEALKCVTLDLYEGKILGLVGHNGAGKSTLLQVLARIIIPQKGTMTMPKGLSTSLLTLKLGFSQELTGRENAILGAMYLGYSRMEAEARLERILDFAEIGEWVNDPVRTYSTGMSARLGFAVAMEMESDVLLIDETLGVGDAYFQKKSNKAIIDKMQQGQTTVLVSHSEATLRKLCTTVAWLHNGETRMVGEPCAVLGAYGEWVAGLQSGIAGITGDTKGCLQS